MVLVVNGKDRAGLEANLAMQHADLLLVGEGAEKERIKSIAQSRGLANVRFLDQQPRERHPRSFAAAQGSDRAIQRQ